MSCSIKRPGLKFSKKSLLNHQVHLKKINCTVLFQGCHSQFLGSIKQPGLDIWKKSIKRPVLSFFSNSRSLERPGLIIETLENASWVKRRSFQENIFKWMKNSVEKINVTIQKCVYFSDTCVENIKVMDIGVLRSEMGWTQMSKTQWIKGITRPECIRLLWPKYFYRIFQQ